MPGRTSVVRSRTQSWAARNVAREARDGSAPPTAKVRDTQKKHPSTPTVSVSTNTSSPGRNTRSVTSARQGFVFGPEHNVFVARYSAPRRIAPLAYAPRRSRSVTPGAIAASSSPSASTTIRPFSRKSWTSCDVLISRASCVAGDGSVRRASRSIRRRSRSIDVSSDPFTRRSVAGRRYPLTTRTKRDRRVSSDGVPERRHGREVQHVLDHGRDVARIERLRHHAVGPLGQAALALSRLGHRG